MTKQLHDQRSGGVMASSDRRQRERVALRERILNSARELILQEGYDKLTIRKLADRIEYSPMALYSHFKDKQAILVALASESFEKFLTIKPESGGDALQILRKSLVLYVEYWGDHPDEYRLLFMSRPNEPNKHASHANDLTSIPNSDGGRDAFNVLVKYVDSCIEAKKIQGDAFSLARVIWTCVHGAVALQIALPNFPFGDRAQYIELLMDTLFGGLLFTASNSNVAPETNKLHSEAPSVKKGQRKNRGRV